MRSLVAILMASVNEASLASVLGTSARESLRRHG